MYNNGEYNESIQIALENTNKSETILETLSGRQLPKDWLPFNVRCETCGRLSTPIQFSTNIQRLNTPVIVVIVGEVDIRKGGQGKLSLAG